MRASHRIASSVGGGPCVSVCERECVGLHHIIIYLCECVCMCVCACWCVRTSASDGEHVSVCERAWNAVWINVIFTLHSVGSIVRSGGASPSQPSASRSQHRRMRARASESEGDSYVHPHRHTQEAPARTIAAQNPPTYTSTAQHSNTHSVRCPTRRAALQLTEQKGPNTCVHTATRSIATIV